MMSSSLALKIPEPEDIIDAPEKTVIKIDEGAMKSLETEVSIDVPVERDQPVINGSPVEETALSEVTDAPVEVPNDEAIKSFDAPVDAHVDTSVDVSNKEASDEVTEAHLAQKIDLEQEISEHDSEKDVLAAVQDKIKPETPIHAADNVEIKPEVVDESTEKLLKSEILQNSKDEDAEINSEIKASDSDELKTEKTDLAEKQFEEIDSIEKKIPEAEMLKNAPLEVIPAENVPVAISQVENAPVENAPIEAVAVENLVPAPVEAENTPSENTPLEDSKISSVETNMIEQRQVPVEKETVEQVPVGQVPVEQSPLGQVPVEKVPRENNPVENAPIVQIPVKNSESDISAEKSIIEHFEDKVAAQNDDLLEETIVQPVNAQNVWNADEVQAKSAQVEVLSVNNNFGVENSVFKRPEIQQPLIPNANQQSDNSVSQQMNQPLDQQIHQQNILNNYQQNIPQRNQPQNPQQNFQQNNGQPNFSQYGQQNQALQPLIPNAYQNSQHDSQLYLQQQAQNIAQNIAPVQQQPNQYNSNQYQQPVPQKNGPLNNVPQNNIIQNNPNFVQNVPSDAEPKFDAAAVGRAPSDSLDGLIPIPSNNIQPVENQNIGNSDNFNLEPVQPPSRQGLNQPKPNLELNNDQIAKLLTMNAAEQKKYLFEIAENENHQDDFESLQRSPVLAGRGPDRVVQIGGQESYINQDANQDERLSFEDNNLDNTPVEENNNHFMQPENEENLIRDQNEKLVEQPFFGEQPKYDEPSYNRDQPVNMDPNIQAGENPYGVKKESPYEVNEQVRDDNENPTVRSKKLKTWFS